MSITDVFRVNQIKAELTQATQERDDLRRLLAETNRLDLHEIQAQIGKLTAERDQAQAALEDLRFRSVKEHQQLQADFEKRKDELMREYSRAKWGSTITEWAHTACVDAQNAGKIKVNQSVMQYEPTARGAEKLMARAEAVGAPVLALTIDLAVVGARHRDTRNGMGDSPTRVAQLRRGLDLVSHPGWVRRVPIAGKPLTFGNLAEVVPGARTPEDFKEWVDAQFDPSVTWDDIAWVRENWKGKLVVKGVLDPEDARKAVDAGVDGVAVSNHGGRQLDAVPSTAAALPGVAEAVGDETTVLADGGIRNGLDMVKMLALGAEAVIIGRAWAWAVAAEGQTGVEKMLRVLKSDADVALALTGQNSVAGLGPDSLV